MKTSTLLRVAMTSAALLMTALAARGADFEGGIPSGWDCAGTCGTLGADGAVTLAPGGHARYGYVVSEQGEYGVSPWSSRSETDGSVLRSAAFRAEAGDSLALNFNLMFSDGTSHWAYGDLAAFDYGWVRLLRAGSGAEAAVLVTLTMEQLTPGLAEWGLLPPGLADLSPSPVRTIHSQPTWSPFGLIDDRCWNDQGCGHTGWVNARYTIESAGRYMLEFGAIDGRDEVFPVGLAFDDITLAGQPLAAVPEPGVGALMLVGLATVGGLIARRHRSGPFSERGAHRAAIRLRRAT